MNGAFAPLRRRIALWICPELAEKHVQELGDPAIEITHLPPWREALTDLIGAIALFATIIGALVFVPLFFGGAP